MTIFILALWIPAIFAEEDDEEVFYFEDGEETIGYQGLPLLQDENVTLLNQYTFAGNVLEGKGRAVDQWVVLYCVDWFEPCLSMSVLFQDLASYWEEQLNLESLFETTVRFAYVDCAVDKVLCNTQDVDGYPAIAHYSQHKMTGMWMGTVEEMHRIKEKNKLPNWLEARLLEHKPSPTRSPSFSIKDFLKKHGVSLDTIAGVIVISLIVGAAGFMIVYDPLAALTPTTGLDVNVPAPAETKEVEHLIPDAPAEPELSTSHRFLPEEWANHRETIEL